MQENKLGNRVLQSVFGGTTTCFDDCIISVGHFLVQISENLIVHCIPCLLNKLPEFIFRVCLLTLHECDHHSPHIFYGVQIRAVWWPVLHTVKLLFCKEIQCFVGSVSRSIVLHEAVSHQIHNMHTRSTQSARNFQLEVTNHRLPAVGGHIERGDSKR